MANNEEETVSLLISNIRECVLEGKWTLREARWKKGTDGSRRITSIAWNTFYEIEDDSGTVIKDHVCCLQCKKVYKFQQINGTSKLISHQTSCLRKCIDEFPKASENGRTRDNKYMSDLSPEDRMMLTNACAQLIVRDMRPINALYGHGTRSLLKSYAYICIKYNAIKNDPLDYLPTHRTVAAKVISQYDRVKLALTPILHESFSEAGQAGGAVCLDLWTDNYRKVSYMGVTIHFIDNKFKLHARVIANKALCPNRSKTGQYVKEVLTGILAEYGIDVNSKMITFVTDRGSNIKKALEHNTRLNDAPHFMHNTVKNLLKEGRPKKVCDDCKNLVAHVKHSELNFLFDPTLKQSIDIRWNSALDMFSSVLNNWDKIQEVLTERNELRLMEDVKEEDVRDLVNLLTPFRNATLNLESRKKPTLHLVCIFYKIIENHLRPKPNDSLLISEAKQNCEQYFLETLITDNMVQVQHRMALFLHPCLKRLRKMTPLEQNQVYQEVRVTCTLALYIHTIYCIILKK